MISLDALPAGVYSDLSASRAGAPVRPGIVFDRDGVLIVEAHYLSNPDDVCLEQGSAAFLRRVQQAGWGCGVATNQAGIARGYFDWAAYRAVAARLNGILTTEGCPVEATIACGYHAKYGEQHPDGDFWRKPGPGMALYLLHHLALDPAHSWLIGDKASDLGSAKTAGMRGGIHLLTGHGRDAGEREAALALADERFTVLAADSLLDCMALFDPEHGFLSAGDME